MKESIYFPGLNGIRAIAAMLVVFSHIGLHKHALGFTDGGSIDMAGYGVTMFFVLSGYLITFLLLNEYEAKGRIAYKQFYLRRILRIWPIYYLSLTIASAYNLFHGEAIDKGGLLFYVFLMANVPFVFGGGLGMVAQLWSVGVEEQFYLFWPWLFKKREKLLFLMISIIVLFLGLRLLFRIIENGAIYAFIGVTRFHCMAIGGIGALAVYEKWRILKFIYSRWLQIASWGVLFFSIYRPFHFFSIIDGEIYSLIFLVMIINVSTNPKTIISLENWLLNWLGKISYGIYVYHMFALTICFGLLKNIIPVNWIGSILIYVLCTALTLLFASLSYQYFEKFFLRLKQRFSVVLSSNEAGEKQSAKSKQKVEILFTN